MEKEAPRLDVLILSLEMATTGGLVPSRTNEFTAEEVLPRLQRIEDISARNPKLKIWAYGILQRIARTGTGKPDADNVTALISRYVTAADEAEATRNLILEEQAKQWKRLIPPADLEAYLAARKRNHAANLRMIEMAGRGVFELLVIGMDDNAVYGPQRNEREDLEKLVGELGLRDRVFIKPGADELAQLLMLRAALMTSKKTPGVFVTASDPTVLQSVPPLEDRPINDSISQALQLAGAKRVGKPERGGPVIFVHNNPAWNERDAEGVMELVDKGYRVSVADVAGINRGSVDFAQALGVHLVDLSRMAGYAGWNTASNAMGTAIAMLLADGLAASHYQKKLRAEFLIERFADDMLFMGRVRPALQIRAFHGDTEADRYVDMRADLVETLKAEVKSFFNHFFLKSGYNFQSLNLNIPWFRLFEIDVDVNLTSRSE
jgi:hypothetical protein